VFLKKEKMEITSFKYDWSNKRNKEKRYYSTHNRLHSAGSLLSCTGSHQTQTQRQMKKKKYGDAVYLWAVPCLLVYTLGCCWIKGIQSNNLPRGIYEPPRRQQARTVVPGCSVDAHVE